MNEPKVGVGVSVIIFRDDSILLGLRQGSHGADTWATPGGHIEFGETVVESAERGCLEEIGLKVHVNTNYSQRWNEKVWESEQKHYITIYVVAEIDEEDNDKEPIIVEAHKCQEWRWVKIKDLKKYKLFETQRMCQIIESVAEERYVLAHSEGR